MCRQLCMEAFTCSHLSSVSALYAVGSVVVDTHDEEREGERVREREGERERVREREMCVCVCMCMWRRFGRG